MEDVGFRKVPNDQDSSLENLTSQMGVEERVLGNTQTPDITAHLEGTK
jgi:hypothetical protein